MRIKLLIFSIILSFTALAQQKGWDIVKPLDRLTLVSTFGELRPDHFHSGLDFSGHGHTGAPVHAIDDGYISRISISSDGYGNALYIIHPNGKKSVYGHLLRFADNIQDYVVAEQYKRQKFEVNLYPEPGEIKVKKDQIIGYVGNTGRSYGPHLHFEIRNAYLDYPVNPLLFLPWIKDNTHPRILRYAVYPATDTSLVQGRHKKIILPATRPLSITTYGPVYFGIETYDFIDGHYSRKAVYDVKIYIDDTLWMWYRFDKIMFSHTRDVNTLMDYAAYIKNKFKIQRSLITPGNRLCIYRLENNRGIFFSTAGTHRITYIVSDFFGNKARLTFTINAREKPAKPVRIQAGTVVNYGQVMTLDTGMLTVIIPDSALYDSIHFHFKVLDNNYSPYSPLYLVQGYQTPLRWPIELRFRLSHMTDTAHTAIVYIDYKGKLQSLTTHIKDGYAIARSRRFGSFFLTRDTIEPHIELITASQLSLGQKLAFRISDNLSEIKTYKVIVNRRWTLFAYDAKTSTLWARIDNRHFVKGPNHVAVYVTDGAGNRKKRDFLITVR